MKKSAMMMVLLSIPIIVLGQNDFKGRKFEQLGTILPTPNTYRTASGAPGREYWQQEADYVIKVELNDENQTISGVETITYHNNSPDNLSYLWLQLDQNRRSRNSDSYSTETNKIKEYVTGNDLREIIGHNFDLGFKVLEISDINGKALSYTVNKTMMRVEIPILKSGEIYQLIVKWYYNINDRMKVGGRSGMEYFEGDGNYLYSIAQFYPRMCVYDDVNGWQNKQFLGSGEFTLPFGNYTVSITVPKDHIVGATGLLQNPDEVLTPSQKQLLEKARNSSEPIMIVSQQEAEQKEKKHASEKKTWIYHADSVRDFAFASSRKFIWDAMGVSIGGKNVMVMSYYPKEANPLYEQYSTRVVAHTLKIYSEHTVNYPYPKAISVEANNGMEYPMICFNYGRPEKDGTYSDQLKYGMISVIIHEVGHNFFPMIINSDERQWTWMDEGMNTFMQYIAEKAWDPDYPSRRGDPQKIVPYMKGSKDSMVPIMTNSEQIKQFGNNAYAKPATALNILRETVMGEELFDYAFKQYCQRWAFKHPTPADFFRTMEDASAVDLDWFWKGWFYTTDHVDQEIADVTWYKYDTEIEDAERKNDKRHRKTLASDQSGVDSKGFTNVENLSQEDKLKNYKVLTTNLSNTDGLLDYSQNYYEVKLKNVGGLVMPVILQFNFRDGSSEIRRIPAEIWRKSEEEVTKVFMFKKELASISLDPNQEIADVNETNNNFPQKDTPSRFDQFKERSK